MDKWVNEWVNIFHMELKHISLWFTYSSLSFLQTIKHLWWIKFSSNSHNNSPFPQIILESSHSNINRWHLCTSVNLGKTLWLLWLVWIVQCDRSDTVWLLRLGYKRWNSFCLTISLDMLALGIQSHLWRCCGHTERPIWRDTSGLVDLPADRQHQLITHVGGLSWSGVQLTACAAEVSLPHRVLHKLQIDEENNWLPF